MAGGVTAAAELWIDRGGTFTDAIARLPDGRIRTLKLPSSAPGAVEDAALSAIRALTQGVDAPVIVKMGTTVATNALLERRGAPTLLMITRGHGDALRIGHQARPDIFALAIERPEPLYRRVAEVDERVDAEGRVLVAPDLDAAAAALRHAQEEGITAVAIALLHAARFPAHEQALAALARRMGFAQVSASHEVAPVVRLLPRAETTVADATLSPPLARHVGALAGALGDARLMFMQSDGVLVPSGMVRGSRAVLSGPAGGLVGMAAVGRAHGHARLIGFDMGGTSTDVSHWDGRLPLAHETAVAGVRLAVPMLDIHTVAAGGGSICRLEAGRLLVGPQSAGAVPGPACYGRGGPLTVTDCNVALGRVRAETFPALFGLRGDQPIDAAASRAALGALADNIAESGAARPDPLALAESLVAIADTQMAAAIRHISVARGHDPEAHALVAFGGAGGQHACALADRLGMRTILLHPLAGFLSAMGIGLADLGARREAPVHRRLDPAAGPALAGIADRLEAEARAALLAQPLPVAEVAVERRALLHYAGAATAIDCAFAPVAAMAAEFARAHRARFGFDLPGSAIMCERLVALASGRPPGAAGLQHACDPQPPAATGKPAMVTVRFASRDHVAPLLARAGLTPGQTIAGPAIIAEDGATTVLAPGWTARLAADGTLILERGGDRAAPRRATAPDAAPDAARLELFHAQFMAVATEMGVALEASARSINIRERLDFSCALFDSAGRLVANAPHIPVHLGSMGASVQAVIAARRRDGRGFRAGDIFALNTPWNGGTHLPDITVLKPCFLGEEPTPAFFVAARGHHADVGGITPGSMPAASRRIDEEGVILDDLLMVEDGRLREAALREALAAGDWPARDIDCNIADLVAQAAACQRGAEAMAAMVAREGAAAVRRAMADIQANAAQAVAALIDRLHDGSAALPMDNGAWIRVAVRVDRRARRLMVDFTGTSAATADNFNAPASVARAALLYVLRCLLAAPVPLNDGALQPVQLIVPAGSILDARPPSAVVAGNVETSQIVTDALFMAFGAMAAAQGTMNNLTFGDGSRQYYETIAGGAGAGAGFAGASGVHTHMTNSRLTDPEILEMRHPVRVDHFGLRHGSGGAGRWPGGDGVVRRLRFLAPLSVSILSGRRLHPPPGLAGGAAGAAGQTLLWRADGRCQHLAPAQSLTVEPGDAIEIRTPGGGGYGTPVGDADPA